MQEVEVDRQSVERGEARLAVGTDRLRAAVRDPGATGAHHPALGHDPRALVRAACAQGSSEHRLVVAVRARRVEDGDARVGRGGDRREHVVLVERLARRQTHAAETDAQLRVVEPAKSAQSQPQASEGDGAMTASARSRLAAGQRAFMS